MGAIGEALVAYMQPLIDATDGSIEQIRKASALGQARYSLGILPEDSREPLIAEVQSSMKMDDREFAEFRSSLIEPMIRRHAEMFPEWHGRSPSAVSRGRPPMEGLPQRAAGGEADAGTDRYAPCPRGSGEKSKFCCGKKGR